MSVAPFIPHHAFDPETLDALSAALAKVCAELGLSDRADRLTEFVAKHVIEAAQKGLRDEASICQFVLDQFKTNPQ